jgi:hypothetical protein
MITRDVDRRMRDIEDRENAKNELHTKINVELKVTLNSINVILGQTGSGKSRVVFREIAKLNYIPDNPYHQFIYITDEEENDKTFIKYRKMIELGGGRGIQIRIFKYEEAFEELNKIRKAKNLYERIQSKKENRPPEHKAVLLNFLNVPNFSVPALHTAILFDDATDCFKNANDPLHRFFLRNRHHKFTYFFNVHNLGKDAIPKAIKSNMRSFWFFGGFSKHDFNTAIKYCSKSLPNTHDEIWRIYRGIPKRDVLFFDFCEDGTKMEIMRLDNGDTGEEEWFMEDRDEEDNIFDDNSY